ncbi:MAG: DUF2254 domain-containing protein [Aridibacter famidurans]|nr:DUF2254 domain-containing protein [Aridibacter famidurans]
MLRMQAGAEKDKLRFYLNRIREHLWFRPAVMCIVAISAVFLARTADYLNPAEYFPDISFETLEKLLTVISGSMLVIATFAVGSMVSAYASASNTATPRSFSLVIADDVSQNALSAFIGAFIFSIVGLIAVENSYYGRGGRFALFVLILLVFVIVILTFVRWVDRIARLGRLGPTIRKVEKAAAVSMRRRRNDPRMGGVEVTDREDNAENVAGSEIGFIQRIDMSVLQNVAEDASARIEVAVLPGSFVFPGRELAIVKPDPNGYGGVDPERVREAFVIGDERTFDEDPKFGLIALSEIASRALSPGINDPGTAIEVISSLVRLFAIWSGEPSQDENDFRTNVDRVEVPELPLEEMFDDAFGALARDGAGMVEVVIRLQKSLGSLASRGDEMREVADLLSKKSLDHAENALELERDKERIRKLRSEFFGRS